MAVMNICTSLLLFYANKGLGGYVLANNDKTIPQWLITDFGPDSLTLIKEKITTITGIKDWPLQIKQVGAFEFNRSSGKDIHIVYALYLADKQAVRGDYKWVDISDTKELDDEFLTIIRYAMIARY
jgi:hypothetical protein